jgi:hypothetical protein
MMCLFVDELGSKVTGRDAGGQVQPKSRFGSDAMYFIYRPSLVETSSHQTNSEAVESNQTRSNYPEHPNYRVTHKVTLEGTRMKLTHYPQGEAISYKCYCKARLVFLELHRSGSVRNNGRS